MTGFVTAHRTAYVRTPMSTETRMLLRASHTEINKLSSLCEKWGHRYVHGMILAAIYRFNERDRSICWPIRKMM